MIDLEMARRISITTMLKQFPPLIRDSLLSLTTFRARFGSGADAIISFFGSGISVSRTVLFDAVRQIYQDNAVSVDFKSIDGQKCSVAIGTTGDESLPILISGEHSIRLASLWALGHELINS